MAGDWIKMRTSLWTCPQVVRIMSALQTTKSAVVGALFRLWSIADEHSEDGNLPGYTLEIIDTEVGIPGFAKEVVAVDWLTANDKGLMLNRFTEHNGQTAKRRAQDSQRKRGVRKTSATEADTKRTREEKQNRRKETSYSQECATSDSDSLSRPRAHIQFIDAIEPLMVKSQKQGKSDRTCRDEWWDLIWPEDASPEVAIPIFEKAMGCIDRATKYRGSDPRMAVLTNYLKDEGIKR